MTYCLGIVTRQGLVMASDSRSNAGTDQVTTCRKMFSLSKPGERVFVLLASGGLSLSQSALTMLQEDFEKGQGLAKVGSMFEAAREVGAKVRRVADVDREALEKDGIPFNVHYILGGQIGAQPPDLYLIYPQGNPLKATEECPYLQIGEIKYGRPILDRGVRFAQTSLEEAVKYALISIDSTMRSNVTVGPPIDLLAYRSGDLRIREHRRFSDNDADLLKVRTQWEQSLRRAVQELPTVTFGGEPGV